MAKSRLGRVGTAGSLILSAGVALPALADIDGQADIIHSANDVDDLIVSASVSVGDDLLTLDPTDAHSDPSEVQIDYAQTYWGGGGDDSVQQPATGATRTETGKTRKLNQPTATQGLKKKKKKK